MLAASYREIRVTGSLEVPSSSIVSTSVVTTATIPLVLTVIVSFLKVRRQLHDRFSSDYPARWEVEQEL